VSISQPSQSFSPNGDNQEDTLNVGYCLTRSANVTVTVKNSVGTLVRTIQSDVSEQGNQFCNFFGNTSFSWDGRNDSNNVVADGTYTITVHAVDSSNNVSDASYQTAVDTRTPGQLTTPAPNATLSGTVNFVFTPTAGFST